MGATRAAWQGGRVVFASLADFDAEFTSFISKGAVLVSGPDLPRALESFDFSIEPPGGAPPVKLRGMIVSTTPGGALIQIMDFSAAIAASLRGKPPAAPARTAAGSSPAAVSTPPAGISPVAAARAAALTAAGAVPSATEFAPESSGPKPSTGVFPMTAPVLSGPLSGELVNPVTLAAMAMLPLGPIAAVRDLQRVSTVGLVRYLGARRATGWLTVSGDGVGRRWGVEKGAFLLAPHEREAARPAFGWAKGSYAFEPAIPDRPAGRTPVPAWRLVLDAVRARLREGTHEELRQIIDVSRAVRLGAAYLERSRSLELNAQEERVIKRDLDGRQALSEVVKLGAISELGLLRLVYLLQIMGLAELVAPQGEVAAAEDEVRGHYERTISADLFAALGLHWSDPPERIVGGLEAVKRQYGADSPAAASSPDYAAKVVELAERAHRRLKDKAERRRYREELGLDVRHAAELLMAQVPLARARGEFRKAYELASAACDLYDRSDWLKLRDELMVYR